MEKCAEDVSKTHGYEDHSNRQVKKHTALMVTPTIPIKRTLCVSYTTGLEFTAKTQ